MNKEINQTTNAIILPRICFFSIILDALVNSFNHTSWVTTVTPTDRPKSVRNSCIIKVFGGVFMLSRCFLDCSVGVGVFVTGLSQISSLFSYIRSDCP